MEKSKREEKEKSPVKERMLQFIQYKKLKINEFERMCGLGRNYVGNISKSMQPEKITLILNAFPELNLNWLFTGNGEMFAHAPQNSYNTLEQISHSSIGVNNTNGIQGENIEKLLTLLTEQQKEITAQREFIEKLINKIAQ